MEVSESNMNISHTLFHHSNINVSCSCVWMRESTCKMEEEQSTVDISAENKGMDVSKKAINGKDN